MIVAGCVTRCIGGFLVNGVCVGILLTHTHMVYKCIYSLIVEGR